MAIIAIWWFSLNKSNWDRSQGFIFGFGHFKIMEKFQIQENLQRITIKDEFCHYYLEGLKPVESIEDLFKGRLFYEIWKNVPEGRIRSGVWKEYLDIHQHYEENPEKFDLMYIRHHNFHYLEGDDSMLEELRRCRNSPYYFATKYLMVNGKPFVTHLSQEDA